METPFHNLTVISPAMTLQHYLADVSTVMTLV